MGILDDAIKEHLELKRQHGADASELKQLEDEAFGAAERPGDGGPAPDELDEAPTQFMQQPEEAEASQEPAEEESPAMEHEAVREEIAEQPTEMYDVEAELGEGEADPEDFFDEQRLSDELDQALEAPAEEDEEREELRPAEGEEDVLEETPDFLEETPEDDRLWFEQKPPKDFDFDD
jgi:hypothetical protein